MALDLDESAHLEQFRASLASFSFASPPRRSLRIAKISTKTSDEESISSSERTPITRKEKASIERIDRKRSRNTVKNLTIGSEQKVKVSAKLKAKRGYAPPQTYAHLKPLSDYLKEELDVLFCGINPGVKSAQLGHHFANPSNHFWHCLHASNLTPAQSKVSPTEDYTLPDRFNLGLTNIVHRPSAEAGELATCELSAGVPELLSKIARYRPRIVCFIGKQIWVAVERVMRSCVVDGASREASSIRATRSVMSARLRVKAVKPPFAFDIQPYKAIHPATPGAAVHETLFFVLPSTSGRVVSHQRNDKTVLCELLKQRLEYLKAGKLDTSSMVVINLPLVNVLHE